MRTMMKIKMDVEAGSRAVGDGTVGRLMEDVLGPLRPEAAYFGPEDGMRTAWIVFDLQDPSQLPALTEPIFRELKATVELFPVMNQDDLQKGLQQLSQAG